MNTKNTAKRT